MGDALRHRGPDDAGLWLDAERGIALVHRRLSVVDLSAAGHQPMVSADERYVIAYNGEIYNFSEVRLELERLRVAPRWRGHSDTEVLLAAIVAWGIRGALERCVGMFAFALWDRTERILTLARDRVGEKPLFYGRCGSLFLFGSELKALRAHPRWRGEIDRDVLSLYLRFGYLPAPYCIYRGLRKLEPGTYLQIAGNDREPAVHAYWSARTVAEAGMQSQATGNESALADELDALLRQSIRGQMIADVPVGAFLSGGIDSSAVVALMQAQSTRPVRTFSIGFNEAGYDEAHFAKAVAQHLRTDHTELYVTPAQAREVIPLLPEIYDEPFADSSQIPTHLVARLARQHVTVVLSGDGGDELFGGYNRYLLAERIWRMLTLLPAPARSGLARGLLALSQSTWDRLLLPLRPILPRQLQAPQPGQKVHKLAAVLEQRTIDDVYLKLVSQWQDPHALVPGAAEPPSALTDGAALKSFAQPLARMMYLDLVSYLPDDILVKVDRASMAVSLETRIPLLDHRLIEFAWRVPMRTKVAGGTAKRLLRSVLYRYVPQALLDRPKMGFGVPIDSWLRGPLRPWADHLLDPVRLKAQGFLAPEPITRAWREHRDQVRDWHYPLWAVLMFQAWHEQTHERKSVA